MDSTIAPKSIRYRRTEILQEVDHIINGARNSEYGSAEDNFSIIAGFWSVYLTASTKKVVEVSAMDVASLMSLLKVARLTTNPAHRDSWIDIIGYAACGTGIRDDIEARKASNSTQEKDRPYPSIKTKEEIDSFNFIHTVPDKDAM